MFEHRTSHRIVLVVIVQLLLLIVAASLVQAAGTMHPGPETSSALGEQAMPDAHLGLLQSRATTLQVDIVSSPWATLDHNNPSGTGEEVPKVFVVEAMVTNLGIETATDVVVTLDYNEEPVNNWVLLPGENPVRTLDSLAPGEVYHAYWFARYSLVIGASHQYTVTALADNASPVATSDNYYGNPEPGQTVKTRSALSTGNSG
ncbi:MAG: hypothetical protein PVJ34_11375, partial [Anaerolineae bacterium]